MDEGEKLPHMPPFAILISAQINPHLDRRARLDDERARRIEPVRFDRARPLRETRELIGPGRSGLPGPGRVDRQIERRATPAHRLESYRCWTRR